MRKITLIGGIAIMAMSLTFFSSCKKEEITSKKPVSQSGNQNPAKHEYKFSSVAKIPGETPENGFLSLTVSSDDEAFLKKYVAKLEQTKILMEEVASTVENNENVHPLFDEQSNATVGLVFDWTNFSFNKEKGKLYAFRLLNKSQSKSLVYYNSLSNQSSFDIGGPTVPGTVAAVNVYSTYNNACTWYFNNTVNDFYSKGLNYHDNLELRCFQGGFSILFGPPPSGFGYFTISGITTFYRPRLNYSSPEMPTGYTDVDAINSGYGYVSPLVEPGANLTFYIAG